MSEESISSYFLHFPFTSADFFRETPPHQKTRPLQKVWIAPANKLTKHWICLGGFGGRKKYQEKTSAVFFYKFGFCFHFPLFCWLRTRCWRVLLVQSLRPSATSQMPWLGSMGWFQVFKSKGEITGKSTEKTPLLTRHFASVGCEVSCEVTLNFKWGWLLMWVIH